MTDQAGGLEMHPGSGVQGREAGVDRKRAPRSRSKAGPGSDYALGVHAVAGKRLCTGPGKTNISALLDSLGHTCSLILSSERCLPLCQLISGVRSLSRRWEYAEAFDGLELVELARHMKSHQQGGHTFAS